MNSVGRARNARLNQAMRHIANLSANLAILGGRTMYEYVDAKDGWQDARNDLEKLIQCFHEANAYNNALTKLPANTGGE